MGRLLFITANLLAAYIAVSLANLTMRDCAPWRRFLASLSGFPVVVLVCVLITGSVGKLSAISAVALLGFMAVVLSGVQIYKKDAGLSAVAGNPIKAGIPGHLAIVLLALFLAVYANKTFLAGTSFVGDDLTYHAPQAAHWLEDERLSTMPFTYQAYYPLNSEVFALWFMMPFRGDGLVGLCGYYWAALAAAAITALCITQGLTLPVSLFTAILFLVSPTVLKRAITFCSVDMAGAATALAAIALMIPSPVDETEMTGPSAALYGGLLSGFAAGCKVSFAPVPLVLLLWLILHRRKHSSNIAKEISLFVLAASLTSAYWYIRNVLLTGNPLFPARFGPFDGPFGIDAQYRSQIISWVWADPLNLKQWKYLIRGYMNWPFSLGVLAIIGYGGALYSSLMRKSSTLQNILLVTGLSLLIVYPLTPFSATINYPTARLGIFRRYLFVPFAIGLVLFSTLTGSKSFWQKFWSAVFIAVAGMTVLNFLRVNLDVRAVISGVVLAGLWNLYRVGVIPPQIQRLTGPISLLIILGALALRSPYFQLLTDAKIHNYERFKKFSPDIGNAWRYLESVPAGSRVAGLGISKSQYYPLFGRKFQLTPRFFHKHLHEYWRDQNFWDAWCGECELTLKDIPFRWNHSNYRSPSLVPEMIRDGVDYIMVSIDRKKRWPRQRKKLFSSKLFQRVYKGDGSEVWKTIK